MPRRIPIPKDVMRDFKKWAAGSKSALEAYLRGYRRSFRTRLQAGETPAQISRSVMKWRREQGWSAPTKPKNK